MLQCFNYKENWYLGVILAAIYKMAAKMCKILKCSNFNENWYEGFFPHEECDSDKSDLKMASYLRLIL